MSEEAGPFRRLIDVRALPSGGQDVTIRAEPAEREALAKLWGEPAIDELRGEFRLTPGRRGEVLARGTAHARLTRACVATLEEFPVEVSEEVDLVFAPQAAPEPARVALTPKQQGRDAGKRAGKLTASEREEVDLASLSAVDPPEPVIDGRIDLGAVTAEFVALQLDPWPRKPGAVFSGGDPFEDDEPASALTRGWMASSPARRAIRPATSEAGKAGPG